MVILGVDPGLTRTGYGVVEKSNSKIFYKESGILRVGGGVFLPERLAFLQGEMENLLRRLRPGIVGVEKIFFAKNVKTGIQVAQARGVLVASAVRSGAEVIETAPTSVKAALTGNGRAGKAALAKMLRLWLKIDTEGFIDDATDAIAVAIAVSGGAGR